MINSMTAFARQQGLTDQGSWQWEIKSVNQRYLDMFFRLPEMFRVLEPQFREELKRQLKRGKIECSLRWEPNINSALAIDDGVLNKLHTVLAQIETQLPTLLQPTSLDVLRWPGIIQEASLDLDSLSDALLQGFGQALEQLIDARAREGAKLKTMIEQRLLLVIENVDLVKNAQQEIQQQLQQKLTVKLQPLLEKIDVDQGRLEQELVLQLQRLDVDEELDRLMAHVTEVRDILNKGGSCGRRLDFMMQEFNREANTLSSKAASTSVVQSGVELKVLIEQMREQIQNIE